MTNLSKILHLHYQNTFSTGNLSKKIWSWKGALYSAKLCLKFSRVCSIYTQGCIIWQLSWVKKTLPADNLIKYKKKTYSEKFQLVNSRYELKQQDNKFCDDISSLFQSHCQTRIIFLQTCHHTIYKETRRDDVLETLDLD